MKKIKQWFKKALAKMRQWLKSKTIWFNAIVIPAMTPLIQYAADNLVLIKDHLGASYTLVLFIVGAINVKLRAKTRVPLDQKTSLFQ